jgi:hypothetical protein
MLHRVRDLVWQLLDDVAVVILPRYDLKIRSPCDIFLIYVRLLNKILLLSFPPFRPLIRLIPVHHSKLVYYEVFMVGWFVSTCSAAIMDGNRQRTGDGFFFACYFTFAV